MAKFRKGKLSRFHDRIGVLPDRKVAQLAKVTISAVQQYRQRHGIPAVSKQADTEAAPEAGAEDGIQGAVAPAVQEADATAHEELPEEYEAADPAESAHADGRRKSKLDRFADRVGVLADSEVARLAGVTRENVRVYRLRHGIPAGWRDESATRRGRKPKVRQTATGGGAGAPPVGPEASSVVVRPVLEEVPEVEASSPTVPGAQDEPVLAWGYMVTVPGGHEYLVVGADIGEAARIAVAGRGPHIESIRLLAPALT